MLQVNCGVNYDLMLMCVSPCTTLCLSHAVVTYVYMHMHTHSPPSTHHHPPSPTQACSILYKTRLPLLLVFNKCDIENAATVTTWLNDVDAYQDAVSKEGTYASTLSRCNTRCCVRCCVRLVGRWVGMYNSVCVCSVHHLWALCTHAHCVYTHT